MQQRTLAKTVTCTGVGVHSGATATVSIGPAAPGTGIVFRRADQRSGAPIPALAGALLTSRLATSLGAGDARVDTVEHLLAACVGVGVHNLRVDVDGPELPALDGSAAVYAELLEEGGPCEQTVPERVVPLSRAVEVRDGDRWARAEPSARLEIDYAIDFAHPAIGRQSFRFESSSGEAFARDLAPARSFGFLRDRAALERQGLARGAGFDNTVVFDDTGVCNPGGLHWPDECVRHKVLDLLGDLALLGATLRARVRVERGGHALHHALVAAIADAEPTWEATPRSRSPREPAPRRRESG